MNAEREQRMMIAAKILAGTPFNELPQDELDIMLNHGNIIGVSFVESIGQTKTPKTHG